MNKLTFKVNGPTDGKLAPLIKEITKIECRIFLDVENGFVTVENVSDDLIDAVIDLINTYYTLLGVEIDNLVDSDSTVSSTQDTIVAEEQEEVIEAPTANTITCADVDTSIPSEPTTSTPPETVPQSAEELIIKKIEFQNPAIEAALNKLLRTAYWAVYKQNNNEKEIVNYIWTAIREMSLRYSTPNVIEFSFGDIVDCYFGTHLPKEINGSHVLGIVADITSENLVYIVPITKAFENIDSAAYITFYRDVDVDYYTEQYIGGTALIDKSRYVRVERLQSVVGKAKPEFLIRIIEQLPAAFNFKHNLDSIIEEIYDDIVDETIDDSFEVISTDVDEPDAENENLIPTKSTMTGEDMLSWVIDDALKLLEPGGPILRNACIFLEAIGMPTDNPILNKAFIVSSDIKKINYENIIAAVHETTMEISEDEIKETLKQAFKNWIATKEELASYNRLAITSLLKLFAKAVRK